MTNPNPRHTWVPYTAALSGACLLLMATVSIATRERIDKPAVVLYLSGLLLAVVAAVGTGLRRERIRARVGVATGLVVLVIAWVVMIGDMLTPLVDVVSNEEHVNDNAPIALLGSVLLALAYRAFSRDRDATVSGAR